MNAKNPNFAIAPKGKFNSFEGGTKFEISNGRYVNGILFFKIISPLTGSSINCRTKNCYHLNGKNWILRNK